MARITVEECLDKVQNRFELILLASRRARQLATGGKEPLVDCENDKPTVAALREIEHGVISKKVLDDQERAEQAAIEAEEVTSAIMIDGPRI